MVDREASGARRGCFRYGCFGCAGLIALVVIAAGVIAVLALVMEPPRQEMVSPDLSRDLTVSDGTATGSASSDIGDASLPSELTPPASAAAGRVLLDLSEGSFDLVAGEPGSPIRVEGEYNAGAYEVIERFEGDPERDWTYRLTFRRSVSWIRLLRAEDEQENRLRITLPSDLPFSLEGTVKRGESDLRLGGLSITAVDLRLVQGEHSLSFETPTPRPLERFELNVTQGAFSVERLGNASPAIVTMRGSMGEMQLDLDGSWRNDAEVHGRWRMGELRVRVPDDVHVDVGEIGMFLGGSSTSGLRSLAPPEEGAPTLKMSFSGSMGEITVGP